MSLSVLTDSCFWIGLVYPKDQYNSTCNEISSVIQNYNILIPWPCLYETVCTRLLRQQGSLRLLETKLHTANIHYIDDAPYREIAIRNAFGHGHTYSLTDCILREILRDINNRINGFVTFNTQDFQDICILRGIPILDSV